MAKISVLNLSGEKVKDLTLKDEVWNIEPNNNVLSEAAILQLSSLRQGTSSTKTRAEVSGTGKKPWRQKGTGRARQGSKRSPQWPGGGIAFGPKPRSYSKKMNKKVRNLALRSALSNIFRAGGLIVVDKMNFDSKKTKDLITTMKTLKANDKVLIVLSESNENILLACRNNKDISSIVMSDINVVDLMYHNSLIIDTDTVKALEEVLL